MQSLQTIKRRMRSVKNIGQITKAMELVAATKMRKAQQVALDSRPYVFAALEMLMRVSRAVGSAERMPVLLERRPVSATAYVVVASDKGLSGSFNSSVFRAFERFVASSHLDMNDGNNHVIAVGEKARLFLSKRVRVDTAFTHAGDYTTYEEIAPIAQYLIDGFIARRWDKVVVFYTSFKSALQQEVLRREILPIDPAVLEETARDIIPESGRFAEILREQGLSFFDVARERGEEEYLIEPSPEAVLESLLPHLVAMQMYHIILEANASEHSARRVAMKNASDNASDLGATLGIEYNKSRQAAITRELGEISAGAEAISNS